MTTRKKTSAAMSRRGVSHVRAIVEAANSTFQEIELSNDIGNDAYIEFVMGEEATGCCVAAQIKSGPSYVRADGSFVVKADRDHFEYWSSHVLPVAGIVVDPIIGKAGWCDITSYLRRNPASIAKGPYRISIPRSQAFAAETFSAFRDHFLDQHRRFSSDAYFGAALDRLTPFNNPEERIDALRSLFSFHRNRPATWCYVASLLRTIEDVRVARVAVRALSHLPGHGDIAWHPQNEIDEVARMDGLGFMRLAFGREEIVRLLGIVDEDGFSRGSIGQAVHSLVHQARNAVQLLQSIAFDSDLDEDIRCAAVFLYTFYTQDCSPEDCICVLEEFRAQLRNGVRQKVIGELIATLKEQGSVSFY